MTRKACILSLEIALACMVASGCATTSGLDSVRAEMRATAGQVERDVSTMRAQQASTLNALESRVAKCELKVSEMSDRIAELRLMMDRLIKALRTRDGGE